MTTSGVKANGDLYTDTEQYERTAGTSGLMGSWKSTEVKLSSPAELIMQESGLDGLLFKFPAMKASCEANFDGREVAVAGAGRSYRVPPGAHPDRALQFSHGAEIERQHDFVVAIHGLRRWQDDDPGRRGSG